MIFNKREGNTETCNCDFQGFSNENAWIWALWWNLIYKKWASGIKFLRSGLLGVSMSSIALVIISLNLAILFS